MGDHQPHPGQRRMPAGSNERAEMRALGRRIVDMERLWIKAHGKGFDIVGGEGVAAVFEDVAHLDVLEIFHRAASTWRRAIIIELTMIVRTASCSSSTSYCILTKPSSGRLAEARLSSTVVRM